MLGLQLKLTPAQVNLLLIMIHCSPTNKHFLPLEAASLSTYIVTSDALKRRGLMGQNDSGPFVTDEGRAVGNIIYLHAKAIVDLAEKNVSIKEDHEPGTVQSGQV